MSTTTNSTLAIKITAAFIMSMVVLTGSLYLGDNFDETPSESYDVLIDQFNWSLDNMTQLKGQFEERSKYLLGISVSSQVMFQNNESEFSLIDNPIYQMYGTISVHLYEPDNKWLVTGYASIFAGDQAFTTNSISSSEKNDFFTAGISDLQYMSNITSIPINKEIFPFINGTIINELQFVFKDGSSISIRAWDNDVEIIFISFDKYETTNKYLVLYRVGSYSHLEGKISQHFDSAFVIAQQIAGNHIP